LDVFTKFVRLYALKAATTRTCLRKITTDYITKVVRPECILSDNGTQFASPTWKKKLAELNVEVKFCPVRRPQANPSERFMREIGKFFKIYCSTNHRKWPELLPKIEEWLNNTVADSTGYCPVELMFDESKPDIFKKFLDREAELSPPAEGLAEKVMRAYLRMRLKADKRKERRKRGKHEWAPQVGDLVLCRCRSISEAAKGETSKFKRPYEGPWHITRIIPPSAYEISSPGSKVRGIFHKQALKPYKEP
jgi:hypothetical protein